MQAASSQALATEGIQAGSSGKPAAHRGAGPHATISFEKVLGAKAKDAARAGVPDRTSILAALHEALKKNHAAAAPHALEAGEAGKAAATAEKKRVQSVAKQPAVPGKIADGKLIEHAAAAEDAEESGKPAGKLGKKKQLAAARHVDGLVTGALAAGAGLPGRIKVSAATRPDGELALRTRAEHGEPVAFTAARKPPDLRIHVLDVRKKGVHAPADETASQVRTPRPLAADRDMAPPLIAKTGGSTETIVHEPRRQSPPVPAQPAGALERLREMAGSELARAAGIVLRDGGGEIKLLLKPESLGSVRIRMNLVDNAIEGRIIVDNPAVKHVFEGNLGSLTRALTAEGFQTASLQVSVGGQGANDGRPDKEAAPRVRRVAAAGFEGNVPGVESMSLGDLLVNLFV